MEMNIIKNNGDVKWVITDGTDYLHFGSLPNEVVNRSDSKLVRWKH